MNEHGSRYMDDGQYWTNDRTRALINQGKSEKYGCYMNYTVIDNAMYEQAVETGGPSGLTDKELQYIVSADTIEELAEKIDASELPATVAKYNEDLANGGDTLFGRTQKLCRGGANPLRACPPARARRGASGTAPRGALRPRPGRSPKTRGPGA